MLVRVDYKYALRFIIIDILIYVFFPLINVSLLMIKNALHFFFFFPFENNNSKKKKKKREGAKQTVPRKSMDAHTPYNRWGIIAAIHPTMHT